MDDCYFLKESCTVSSVSTYFQPIIECLPYSSIKASEFFGLTNKKHSPVKYMLKLLPPALAEYKLQWSTRSAASLNIWASQERVNS